MARAVGSYTQRAGRGGNRRVRRQVSEINVVPYIDVMLVLLVIFMITAPLLRTSVEIDLPDADVDPTAQQAPSANEEPVILSVNPDGTWYLNVSDEPDAPVEPEDAERVVSAIMRLSPDRRVVVAGDTNAGYGEVMQGMVMLKRAGASAIDLITEPPRQ